METIRRHLAEGRRYLVIELVTGNARLMRQGEVFRRSGGTGWVKFTVVDLVAVLEKFDAKAPSREVLTLTEVATMALEKSPTVHSWVKAGVLAPSVRDRDGTQGRAMLFSRRDAFVACLVASLKRQCGLRLSKLRAVSEALGGSETPSEPDRRARRKQSSPNRRRRKKTAKGKRNSGAAS